MNKYKELLRHCDTDRRKELIKSLIKTGNIRESAKLTKMSERGAHRMLEKIRKRQSDAGEGSHFRAKTNLKDTGLIVKGTSTYYKHEDGGQWVKTDREASDKLTAIKEAIEDMVANVLPTPPKARPKQQSNDELINVYISNDLHFGAYMWGEETLDRDYDLKIAEEQLDRAIDYLVENSPKTKVAIIADLGDTLEGDNFKNATPGHGHTLDVDGRYSKVVRVAMQSMVSLVNRALEKHDIVHFINIAGNHDIVTSHAIRAFVEAWFRNEPRVVVDTSPAPQKYFVHGSTLLGFAHGDGLRMHDAGECMAMHNSHRWNETRNRYFHFGHNHKDKIVDGRLCKAESHRNIAPLNSWASHAGFGRQIGTMKSITYCKEYGEKSRQTFNVAMMGE